MSQYDLGNTLWAVGADGADDTSAAVVGQVLCEARDKAGLPQEELAARAGMDRSYVSDVERGEASLSVDRLLRLCRALGVRATTIIGRIERRASRPAR